MISRIPLHFNKLNIRHNLIQTLKWKANLIFQMTKIKEQHFSKFMVF